MVERQIPPTKTTQLVTPQQPVQTQLVCKNEITDCDVDTKAELPGTVDVSVKPLCAAGTPVVHSKPRVTETERAAADSASPRPGLLALVKTFFWKIKDSLTDVHHGSAAMTPSAQLNVTSPSQGPQSKHDDAILGMAKTAADSSCVATRAHVDATTFADQPQERRVLDQASAPIKLVKEDTPATVRMAVDDQADDISPMRTDVGRLRPAVNTTDNADVHSETHELLPFDKIIGHRQDPRTETLFQMRVRWKNGSLTWEPEAHIQKCADQHLFSYWNGEKGKRIGAMADKYLWHVLEVKRHKRTSHGNVYLYISWIGSPERSWEPESRMMHFAQAIVEDYWIAIGGRDKVVTSVAGRPKRHRRRFRNAAAALETAVNAQTSGMRPERSTAWKRDYHGHPRLVEVADEVALAALEVETKAPRTERVTHESGQPANTTHIQPPRKRRRLS